jgi:uncharacterized protein YndB with AHSA1/START domain
VLSYFRKDADMSERIVKVVELKAPVAKVWQAISDHKAFGEWFRVRLDQPFVVGQVTTGQMTVPGFEHYPWRSVTEVIEPERRLVFRWHDFDPDSGVDVADHPLTTVEFRLEAGPGGGTRVTITESGFDAIAEPRRAQVMRDNTGGWDMQAQNLKDHVDA